MEDQPKLSQTWRQKNKQAIIIAIVIILLLLNIFTLAVLWFGWGWTGFSGKTMWDALQLLIVPIILAIGGYWLNRIQNDRENKATEERTRAQQKAEEQQRLAEQDAASRQLLIQALLGEKESIGFNTLFLSMEGLPQDVSYRGQILTSLIQATIFSSSDRVRGMVFSVLQDNYPTYKSEIDKIISSLNKMLEQMERFQLKKEELDIASFRLKFGALKQVLEKSTT